MKCSLLAVTCSNGDTIDFNVEQRNALARVQVCMRCRFGDVKIIKFICKVSSLQFLFIEFCWFLVFINIIYHFFQRSKIIYNTVKSDFLCCISAV